MSRILERELDRSASAVRPRLPSLFEPGLLQLRTGDEQLTDDFLEQTFRTPAARTTGGRRPSATVAGHVGSEPAQPQPQPPRPQRSGRPEPTHRRPDATAEPADGLPTTPTADAPRPRTPTPTPQRDAVEAPVVRQRAEPPADPALQRPRGPGQGRAAGDQRGRAGAGRTSVPSTTPPGVAAPRPAPRPIDDLDGASRRATAAVPPGLVPPPAPSAPVVRIAIGRIEVRGGPSTPMPTPTSSPRPSSRRTPRLTLSDYLDQRQERRR